MLIGMIVIDWSVNINDADMWDANSRDLETRSGRLLVVLNASRFRARFACGDTCW